LNEGLANPVIHTGLYSCDQITLHPELRHWLPERKEEEMHSLERDILDNGGVRDALLVWPHEGKLILIDGYTRFRVAKKHHLKFRVVFRKFGSLDEVKLWMIDNQNNQRRNTTPLQKAYHIGWEYERLKQDKNENLLQLIMPKGKNYPSVQDTDSQVIDENETSKGKNYPSERSSAVIADRNHLSSEKTVRTYHSVFTALEAIKRVNKLLFHDIFTGLQEINLGALEKLAQKDIPSDVETVRDLVELLQDKQTKQPKEKAIVSELSTKLKALYKTESKEAQDDLIRFYQKQIEKTKAFKTK
jgi:hypothetical protein